MKFDDASWHPGGTFPKDLPAAAGATHTGMFVAGAMLSGMASELHTREQPELLERLQMREMIPGQFFLAACDGKFTDEDLSDEGNAFAKFYFDLKTVSTFRTSKACSCEGFLRSITFLVRARLTAS